VTTEKAYAPFSVAFEHPKSSLPPAQAAPLNAGNAIAAASIPLNFQNFTFVLLLLIRPLWPTGDRTPPDESAL
jgi:hypothetical protein